MALYFGLGGSGWAEYSGLSSFQKKAPFASTSLVAFRKRLSCLFLNQANERLLQKLDGISTQTTRKGIAIRDETTNIGTEILDATCSPSNIRYPRDTSLLNEAREKLEKMIDWFYKTYDFDSKPRTYRRVAYQEYLKITKAKKPGAKKIRATIRKQLGYVHRDIAYLDAYMAKGYAMEKAHIDRYLTILKLYEQQKFIYDHKVHRVDDRIVSLSQSYIRPIVRGKAKTPVEFGAKLDISIDEKGHARMEKIAFNPYNESTIFKDALERYKERTGHYPERVLVDQIYRTKANRDYCKEKGIRLSGPRLGRPPKDKTAVNVEMRQDNKDRIEVERFFSLAKRCSGMGIINTRLEETTLTPIVLAVLVTNLFAVPYQTYCTFYFKDDPKDKSPWPHFVFED